MKKIVSTLLICGLMLSLSGCGKKMTLNLAYGDRTGKYSGELNANGLPDGHGKFTSVNSEGVKWTYEGEFKDGHFNGKGKTTWKSGQVEIGTYKDDVIVPMSGEEIKTLYTTPEKFKNHYVDLTGVVFATPEYRDDCVCIQMMSDIKNYDNNTIVYIFDKDFTVNKDDYLHIVGLVGDTFEGENALGGTVTAPTITAKQYEVLSYKDALSPTLSSVQVNQTQTQLGYSITIQKVEYSNTETRVYLKVENNGSDKFNVYSFNAKITQNGKQYEEQDNWDAEYPEIQTDLLVGNFTEGIIAFPPLTQGPFTITLEGSSDNWKEDLKPYIFNIE